MTIIRGTTPTLTLDLRVPDLTDASKVVVSFLNGGNELDKEPDTISDTSVVVSLSQKETLFMRPGICRIKVNWVYASGDRATCDYGVAWVYDNHPRKEL